MDFAVLVDNRGKIKESENTNRYLDLAREVKKLWDMRVTVIPVAIDALGTDTKWLRKEAFGGIRNKRKN